MKTHKCPECNGKGFNSQIVRKSSVGDFPGDKSFNLSQYERVECSVCKGRKVISSYHKYLYERKMRAQK